MPSPHRSLAYGTALLCLVGLVLNGYMTTLPDRLPAGAAATAAGVNRTAAVGRPWRSLAAAASSAPDPRLSARIEELQVRDGVAAALLLPL